MHLPSIQEAITSEGIDGWLFADHHGRDPIAYRILQLPTDLHATRRWYYYIPAHGSPTALVHRIESHSLESLPGDSIWYSDWTEQRLQLTAMLRGAQRVAMQYSPLCDIPYVSVVDAGTVELVRSAGADVVSSANLVQMFEARWTYAQFQSHLTAGRIMDKLRTEAFDLIAEKRQSRISEWDVRCFLRERYKAEGLLTEHGPIVAVNANASDPHYEPTSSRHAAITEGDLVLIDMWAKLAEPDSVYYDITWTGYCGDVPPPEMRRVFDVVAGARDKAIDFVSDAISRQQTIFGYQVDDCARDHIRSADFGRYFIHRTGHSIGTEVHGAGANMDNFETQDRRKIIANTCFSVEPGVYLRDFGIRSEVNMYIDDTQARVTGQVQRELVLL